MWRAGSRSMTPGYGFTTDASILTAFVAPFTRLPRSARAPSARTRVRKRRRVARGRERDRGAALRPRAGRQTRTSRRDGEGLANGLEDGRESTGGSRDEIHSVSPGAHVLQRRLLVYLRRLRGTRQLTGHPDGRDTLDPARGQPRPSTGTTERRPSRSSPARHVARRGAADRGQLSVLAEPLGDRGDPFGRLGPIGTVRIHAFDVRIVVEWWRRCPG